MGRGPSTISNSRKSERLAGIAHESAMRAALAGFTLAAATAAATAV
jgi:hypothetical protein